MPVFWAVPLSTPEMNATWQCNYINHPPTHTKPPPVTSRPSERPRSFVSCLYYYSRAHMDNVTIRRNRCLY